MGPDPRQTQVQPTNDTTTSLHSPRSCLVLREARVWNWAAPANWSTALEFLKFTIIFRTRSENKDWGTNVRQNFAQTGRFILRAGPTVNLFQLC